MESNIVAICDLPTSGTSPQTLASSALIAANSRCEEAMLAIRSALWRSLALCPRRQVSAGRQAFGRSPCTPHLHTASAPRPGVAGRRGWSGRCPSTDPEAFGCRIQSTPPAGMRLTGKIVARNNAVSRRATQAHAMCLANGAGVFFGFSGSGAGPDDTSDMTPYSRATMLEPQKQVVTTTALLTAVPWPRGGPTGVLAYIILEPSSTRPCTQILPSDPTSRRITGRYQNIRRILAIVVGEI